MHGIQFLLNSLKQIDVLTSGVDFAAKLEGM